MGCSVAWRDTSYQNREKIRLQPAQIYFLMLYPTFLMLEAEVEGMSKRCRCNISNIGPSFLVPMTSREMSYCRSYPCLLCPPHLPLTRALPAALFSSGTLACSDQLNLCIAWRSVLLLEALVLFEIDMAIVNHHDHGATLGALLTSLAR